jgi:uncharacterized cysteine cluster protein YcgN (CxxCxxCC family)
MRAEFWRTLPLAELNAQEWEALCDGCAQCCALKLEDADDGSIGYTGVTCRLLDVDTCRCTAYPLRHQRVPDCIEIGPETVAQLAWLPATCAYRLRSEGAPLEWWHYLNSGDRDTVHTAGISVRGHAISEEYVHPDDMESHVLRWVTPQRRKD